MKNKTFLWILVTVALLLQQGCVKDQGTDLNDLRDINEITISGITAFFDVYQYDQLTIVPTLFSTLSKDETHYIYEWTAFRFEPPVGSPIEFFFANTRNLEDFKVDLPVDDYLVRYRVTDTMTGMFFDERFRLSVKTFLTEGFLIMNDVGGKMRLDMLSVFNNEFTFFPDILGHINSELPEQDGPIKILRFRDLGFSPGDYALYLLTQSGTNRIHDETFRWQSNYNVRNHFLPPTQCPPNFVAENMQRSFTNVVLHGQVNGQGTLFNRFPATGIWWNVPVNTLDGINFFNASSNFVNLDGANGWLVFDKNDKSFFQLRTEGARCQRIIPDGMRLPWRNTGMDFIYGAKIPLTNFAYLILKNTAGNYFFLQVNNNFIQTDYKQMNAPDIEQAEFFAVDGNRHQNIYYAVGGKVYLWNISENTSYVALDLGDEKITFLDFVEQAMDTGGSNLSTQIFVGSYNETTKIGTLRSYYTQDRPNLFEKVEEWTGFGKIVSVIFK